MVRRDVRTGMLPMRGVGPWGLGTSSFEHLGESVM